MVHSRQYSNLYNTIWKNVMLWCVQMATFSVLSMDLDHILLITQSKYSWWQLFRDGVLGKPFIWIFFSFIRRNDLLSSTSSSRDLDGGGGTFHSQMYTECLCDTFSTDHLWSHYGIVSDTEVHLLISVAWIILYWWMVQLGIHKRLSPGQHQWTHISRSPPPSDQRWFQRPPRNMGYQILVSCLPKEASKSNFGWDWLWVHWFSTSHVLWTQILLLFVTLAVLRLYLTSLAYGDSRRAEISNSGQVMIRRR
jgi:hypothetical protein